MSEHRHPIPLDWCYRCELGKDEAQASADAAAIENVIDKALKACRFPDEDLAIDAADAVLTWAQTDEGHDVLKRVMGVK